MTYAKVIADSISPEGVRLTTMEVRFHRFVLAEMNTHRVFSRSSASSRAIPLKKQIERIQNDLFMPVDFPVEQRGMQGGESLDEQAYQQARSNWAMAARAAVEAAEAMGELGVHKSISNRLLEPFMGHTAVITSTAWENFFRQRCSPLAQPEIRVAAEMMRDAMEESKPQELVEGEWHLPYIEGEDWGALSKHLGPKTLGKSMYPEMIQISAARCARVSYLTQDGKRDIEQDLDLYEKLTTADPPHWSPLEHVATPWASNRQSLGLDFQRDGQWYDVHTSHLPKVGNLLGWRSLRTEVEAMQGKVTFA